MLTAAATAPSSLSLIVTKGSPGIGLARWARITVTFEVVPGLGIRANGTGKNLWLPGRRVNVPTYTKGDTFSLTNGIDKITVEVR